MKTILFTISHLQRSGPGLVLLGLIKNLDRKHFKPVIVTLSNEKRHSLISDFKKLNTDIYCLDVSGTNTFIIGVIRFRSLIKKLRPDVIHANTFRDILLTAWASPRGCNTCVTLHNDWQEDYTFLYGGLIGTVSAWFQTQALKYIPQKIACSKMLADLLNKKYPYLHFSYVDNGVDTDKFHPVTNKKVLRKQLGLPTDKKIAIWAGNFIDRKNPLLMIEAIRQISSNKFFFIFCGTGPLLSICQEKLKNYSNVLFTGFCDHIETYYQAADVYVSTSLSEGFHLTVYEALFCGLNVVLPDLDIYINLKNQSAVCFFIQKNILELRKIIQNSFQCTTGCTTLQLLMDRYSAHYMARQYMDIYNKLL